jgi:hypothetical protein
VELGENLIVGPKFELRGEIDRWFSSRATTLADSDGFEAASIASSTSPAYGMVGKSAAISGSPRYRRPSSRRQATKPQRRRASIREMVMQMQTGAFLADPVFLFSLATGVRWLLRRRFRGGAATF